tara:strand:+ start:1419 stop:2126 length:708 start_codon:yes stop_codon:yes gene_type:complete
MGRDIIILLLVMLIFFLTFSLTENYINKEDHGYEKVWHYRGAFSPKTIDDLKREYNQNKSKLKTEWSFGGAVGRKNYVPPPSTSELQRVLTHHEFVNRIAKEIALPEGKILKLSKTLPPEYRVYEKGSKMHWHRDSILSYPPQYEVVITLFNDSDSIFKWRKNGEVSSFSTDANTVTVVRAGGVKHAVTEVTQGQRIIIKAAYELANDSSEESSSGSGLNRPKLTTIPKGYVGYK